LSVETLDDRILPSFLTPISNPVGASPQAVVSGYFNSDPFLDLAVANYSDSTVSVLLGNGDGTFQPAQTVATGGGPLSLAVGDFDADGDRDVVTANVSDVSVLLGNGDGTFQPASNIDFAAPRPPPPSVAVGDRNG